MTTKELLVTLCEATGVAGLEIGAVAEAEKLLSDLGQCEVTALGSLVCRVKTQPQQPHVMLTAHIDTIGLIVSYIEDSGFLRVSNCGGIDRSLLLASHVVVHSDSGDYDGVVCSIPPHLNPNDSVVPKVEDIYIDVGFDGEATRKKIALGDRVTFYGQSQELLNGRISARTLDDRAGCAAVILAARKLADCHLNCSLSVVLATMEEVGSQGAKTAANLLSPTHSIVVDVSFGHTPDAPRQKCGILGKGPMIGISPILDNGVTAKLKETAAKEKISYQLEIMGGNTGTDADAVASSGAGVRCGLVSIPQRYMHTPIEVVEIADVEAAANLIAAYVRDEFGGER